MAPDPSVDTVPPGRRRFVAAAMTAIGAAIAAIVGVPLAGFFALPALRRAEGRWRPGRAGGCPAGPPPRPLDRYEYKVEKGVLYAARIFKVNDRLEFAAWHHA